MIERLSKIRCHPERAKRVEGPAFPTLGRCWVHQFWNSSRAVPELVYPLTANLPANRCKCRSFDSAEKRSAQDDLSFLISAQSFWFGYSFFGSAINSHEGCSPNLLLAAKDCNAGLPAGFSEGLLAFRDAAFARTIAHRPGSEKHGTAFQTERLIVEIGFCGLPALNQRTIQGWGTES